MSKFTFEKGFCRMVNGWAFQCLSKHSDRPVSASLELVEMGNGETCLNLVLFLECSGVLFDKEFVSNLFGVPEENVLTQYHGLKDFMTQVLFHEGNYDKIVDYWDGHTLTLKMV